MRGTALRAINVGAFWRARAEAGLQCGAMRASGLACCNPRSTQSEPAISSPGSGRTVSEDLEVRVGVEVPCGRWLLKGQRLAADVRGEDNGGS
jgi:hypothetical protein